MNNNSNFWIGKEVEGRYKGILTLFVVGDQSKKKIYNYLYNNDITHVYFGAGNQSIINNYDTIRFFAKRNYTITYEIEERNLDKVPNNVLKNDNIHIIVTYKSKKLEKLKPTDTIKVEDNKKVYCSTICNTFQTNKSFDYNNDEIL